MRNFEYQKADSVNAAVSAHAGQPSSFVAGGTTLLDLVKIDIMQPERVVDVNGLPLYDVEELDDGWCRVFYSTDSQIPAWIPGFMKDALVNLAAKRSTAWVDAECRKEMGLQLEGSGGGDVGGGDRSASAPPADTPSPTQRSLLLAALVGAYANHFLARTMALKQARRMVSELIAKVAA